MTVEELLQNTDVFLLDMDGTVYFDETPIGAMSETLRRLRKAGKRLIYCTNNSSKTAEEYETKLKKIGFWSEEDRVYTSALASISYLKAHCAGQSAYVLATEKVKKSFAEAGIPLCKAEDGPQVCVLAYDTSFTFDKIKAFNECLVHGSFYMATHPDSVCPGAGVSAPDVGAFIRLFEASSSRLPDVICGKPYAAMGDALEVFLRADEIPFDKSRVAMVGDRLNTDIRFANNSGFTGVLVLSGEAKRADLPSEVAKPDIVLESLNDLATYL